MCLVFFVGVFSFVYSITLFLSVSLYFQATKWVYDPVQQEESEVQERRLLLEEKERWQDHAGGSHEAESAGSRGTRV